jgi:hypothetical protein
MRICEDVTPRTDPEDDDPAEEPAVVLAVVPAAPDGLVEADDADVGDLLDDPQAATTRAAADTPATKYRLARLLVHRDLDMLTPLLFQSNQRLDILTKHRDSRGRV